MSNVGTWDPTNPPLRQRFYGVAPAPVRPGVFCYSGFGYGYLFLPNGTYVDCLRSEAYAKCRALGLDMETWDSLAGYASAAPALSDR